MSGEREGAPQSDGDGQAQSGRSEPAESPEPQSPPPEPASGPGSEPESAEAASAEADRGEAAGEETDSEEAAPAEAVPADAAPAESACAAPTSGEAAVAAPEEAAPATAGSAETAAVPDVCGSAADAFDRLHDRHAPSLTRQVFLLCGRPSLARRSVGHAFRLAWQRWPEVAVDPDPAGWVRAAAYRYALAPWRNFRLSGPFRHARAMRNVPPGDRGLFDALLRLPPSYRAVVLLCDGLGLDPADAAAEMEASSAAAAGRLHRGRAALAERVPLLRDAADGELPALTAALLGQLAAPQPVTLPPAPRVRRHGALRSWGATAAALGLTASVAAAGFALVASDDERNVPRLPVPKKPSATLAPDRQPGRLLPVI